MALDGTVYFCSQKLSCPQCLTRKGKSSSKFVRNEDLAAVRRELKNYEVMKMLMDRWIDLATELSNLRLANKRS